MTGPAVVSRGLDRNFEGESWTSLGNRFHLGWGMCKATEGDTFVSDSFTWNWGGLASAIKANALQGRTAYHFAHPEESVSTQVAHFVNVVEPRQGDALMLDLERGTTQVATNKWAKSFLTLLRKQAPNCGIGLYMGRTYAASATGAGLSKYAQWWMYPRYSGSNVWPTTVNPQLDGNTTGWTQPHIHQFSSTFYGGYDASVSSLTAYQLSGGTMALTAADVALILAAKIPVPADAPAGTEITVAGALGWSMVYARRAVIGAAGANATLADLPADVQTAVNSALASDLVNVAVTVQGKAS